MKAEDVDATELERRAGMLAAADESLMNRLVAQRIHVGMSQADVEEALGWPPGGAREFEAHWSDPRLSEIRRYALAVGVFVRHIARGFSEPKDRAARLTAKPEELK